MDSDGRAPLPLSSEVSPGGGYLLAERESCVEGRTFENFNDLDLLVYLLQLFGI
jgi:hypothetical protein